jgi:hypothetical protein
VNYFGDSVVHLPLPSGLAEDLSLAAVCLPLRHLGFELARFVGMTSYNFPGVEAQPQHDQSIHRVTEASRLEQRALE